MSSSSIAKVPPFFSNHVAKNCLLIVLSCLALPISLSIVATSLFYTQWCKRTTPQPLKHRPENAKTILVTGVSMAKGLSIARALAKHTPHRIIGADVSALSPGRFSAALDRYVALAPPTADDADPYIDSMIEVIERENIDLWVSCSSVGAAVEDAEVVRLVERKRQDDKGKAFRAVQFPDNIVRVLHEKDEFIEFVEGIGLETPESHRCASVGEVMRVLERHSPSSDLLRDAKGAARIWEQKKRFILKPIGVDDRAREKMMTLLPLEASLDATRKYVQDLDISKDNPFQLQQYIHGTEYCTHALVVNGKIKTFTSCPSSDMLMHYAALPPFSALSKTMLAFTHKVVAALKDVNSGQKVSGHLSFDFLVPDRDAHAKNMEDVRLYPIECNPRAHTAVTLFKESAEMACAYLSTFDDEPSATITASSHSPSDAEREPVYPPPRTGGVYWAAHDIVTLLIVPVLAYLFGHCALTQVQDSVEELTHHVVYWSDGTFSVSDPLPWLALCHLYWPWNFVEALRKNRAWSRVNVSTGKVFES
ncbi:hypothetical protein BS50DRAFT_554995 [Corynespora cassiicola Philippines]|uniref:ATP-grasp domain-containing protein n=1 Tax=Corynespora cassiicola Philippines TaxID=1448308 RepID=A0A2T2NHG8_CORCC|nr:hypothetical protein BS50DRAFT_554995 [Corynespora cassiicola Philippines]